MLRSSLSTRRALPLAGLASHSAAQRWKSSSSPSASTSPLPSSSSSFTPAGDDPWARRPAPAARADFPYPRPAMRKTHIEWLLHHGNGTRVGRYGLARETADVTHADGTPTSLAPRRYAYKHHQDHLLVQLIRAGAAVERHAALGLLPRVPGTPEQRDWDPEIPLFLDDGLDEHGAPPAAALRAFSSSSSSSSAAAASSTPDKAVAEMTSRVVNERFESSREAAAPSAVSGRATPGETLEANTMFATYDPAAFVRTEPEMKQSRPFWSRRRWALTDDFMVPMSPKPKNTIKDE